MRGLISIQPVSIFSFSRAFQSLIRSVAVPLNTEVIFSGAVLKFFHGVEIVFDKLWKERVIWREIVSQLSAHDGLLD